MSTNAAVVSYTGALLYAFHRAQNPSRQVRKAYATRSSKKDRWVLLLECRRLFGSLPVYYIFDGNEHNRIIKVRVLIRRLL